jgi:predicted 3-demethylubiquinone-9 3-methyltransferase (glyoxalase superfamily)
MQKITPCLWFDHEAEEAAKFYASIFKNSKIGNMTPLWRSRRKGLRKTEGVGHDRDV